MKILVIRKKVGIINEIPPNEYTKLGPGRSNVLEVKMNINTKSGILHKRNL